MKINGGEEIEDWPGVYAIVNKTNGREYVGSSEKGVLSRIEQHERLLKSGKHNRKQMQEDYNNGCQFEAEIIFILPVGGTRKQLLLCETEEIQKRGAEKELYNAKNWTMSKNHQTAKLCRPGTVPAGPVPGAPCGWIRCSRNQCPTAPAPISTGKDPPRLDQQQKRKSQSERPAPPALAFLLPTARPDQHRRRPDQHREGPRRPR